MLKQSHGKYLKEEDIEERLCDTDNDEEWETDEETDIEEQLCNKNNDDGWESEEAEKVEQVTMKQLKKKKQKKRSKKLSNDKNNVHVETKSSDCMNILDDEKQWETIEQIEVVDDLEMDEEVSETKLKNVEVIAAGSDLSSELVVGLHEKLLPASSPPSHKEAEIPVRGFKELIIEPLPLHEKTEVELREEKRLEKVVNSYHRKSERYEKRGYKVPTMLITRSPPKENYNDVEIDECGITIKKTRSQVKKHLFQTPEKEKPVKNALFQTPTRTQEVEIKDSGYKSTPAYQMEKEGIGFSIDQCALNEVIPVRVNDVPSADQTMDFENQEFSINQKVIDKNIPINLVDNHGAFTSVIRVEVENEKDHLQTNTFKKVGCKSKRIDTQVDFQKQERRDEQTGLEIENDWEDDCLNDDDTADGKEILMETEENESIEVTAPAGTKVVAFLKDPEIIHASMPPNTQFVPSDETQELSIIHRDMNKNSRIETVAFGIDEHSVEQREINMDVDFKSMPNQNSEKSNLDNGTFTSVIRLDGENDKSQLQTDTINKIIGQLSENLIESQKEHNNGLLRHIENLLTPKRTVLDAPNSMIQEAPLDQIGSLLTPKRTVPDESNNLMQEAPLDQSSDPIEFIPGSVDDIFFVTNGSENFEYKNNQHHLYVTLEDETPIMVYDYGRELTVEELLSFSKEHYIEKGKRGALGDLNNQNKFEDYCLRFLSVEQTPYKKSWNYNSGATLVLCSKTEDPKPHDGSLWCCKCGLGYKAQKNWKDPKSHKNRPSCKSMRLFQNMDGKQGFGKVQKPNWGLPKDKKRLNNATSSQVTVMSRELSSKKHKSASISQVSVMSNRELPLKSKSPSIKHSEIHHEPVVRTCDKESNEPGEEEELKLRRSTRPGRVKDFKRLFEKESDKETDMSGISDDSFDDKDYVEQKNVDTSMDQDTETEHDEPVPDKKVDMPKRKRYVKELDNSDYEECEEDGCNRCGKNSTECQRQPECNVCKDNLIVRRDRKYHGGIELRKTETEYIGRREGMKQFAKQGIEDNLRSENTSFKCDEDDLKFEENEIRTWIFKNHRRIAEFTFYSPEVKEAIQKKNFEGVQKEEFQRYLPTTFRIYRTASRKVLELLQMKAEKDNFSQIDESFKELHYRDLYKFGIEASMNPLFWLNPEKLVALDPTMSTGSQIHIIGAVRMLLSMGETKSSEESVLLEIAKKLDQDGILKRENIELARPKWIQNRSEISTMLLEITKSNNFKLLRGIAEGEAKSKKAVKGLVADLTPLPPPDVAIHKFFTSPWSKSTRDRMIELYYDPARPKPTWPEWNAMVTYITNDWGLYHGNRTEIFNKIQYGTVVSRKRGVQSPFKPLHELQNISPMDKRVTDRLHDLGDGLVVYQADYDPDNPYLVDELDKDPDYKKAEAPLLLGAVIGPITDHKTGYLYAQLLFLPPISDYMCDMLEELMDRRFSGMSFYDDLQQRIKNPFFMNKNGNSLLGNRGVNYSHFDAANGTVGTNQSAIRKMLSNEMYAHADPLLRLGQEYALCHSDDVTRRSYQSQHSAMQKALYAFLKIREERGENIGTEKDGNDVPKLRHAPGQVERISQAKLAIKEKAIEDFLADQKRRDSRLKVSENLFVTPDLVVAVIDLATLEAKQQGKVIFSNLGSIRSLLLLKPGQEFSSHTPVVMRMIDLAPLNSGPTCVLTQGLFDLTKAMVKIDQVYDLSEVNDTYLRKVEVKFTTSIKRSLRNYSRTFTANLNLRILVALGKLSMLTGVNYNLNNPSIQTWIEAYIRQSGLNLQSLLPVDETGAQYDGNVVERLQDRTSLLLREKKNKRKVGVKTKGIDTDVDFEEQKRRYGQNREEIRNNKEDENLITTEGDGGVEFMMETDESESGPEYDGNVLNQLQDRTSLLLREKNNKRKVGVKSKRIDTDVDFEEQERRYGQNGVEIRNNTEDENLIITESDGGEELMMETEESESIEVTAPAGTKVTAVLKDGEITNVSIPQDAQFIFQTPRKGIQFQIGEKKALLYHWTDHKNPPLTRSEATQKRKNSKASSDIIERSLAMRDIANIMYSSKTQTDLPISWLKCFSGLVATQEIRTSL